MQFRDVIISGRAWLCLRHGQLCIEKEGRDPFYLPVEDIGLLLLESREASCSAAVLQALALQGTAVILCDEKHLPAAQILPYNRFSRKPKLLRAQIELGKPLRKQLWAAIVRQKIRNQAMCLELCGRDGAARLRELADQVRSGDAGHAEAAAAQAYFPALFGTGFTRAQERLENACLNYGYAILRGCVARSLAAHGLEPALGLWHHSELNAYNLADDLIEPYRPLCDMMVRSFRFEEDEEELETPRKRQLARLGGYLVQQDGKRLRAFHAIDRACATLARCLTEGTDRLELPSLVVLEEGRYE